MSKSIILRGCAIVIILGLTGFAGWLFSLPSAAPAAHAPLVPREETAAMLASLTPVAGKRPLVAVIAINNATETTDYLVPAGILRRADIADVKMLATVAGPVQLFPALKVMPDATIAAFDAAHPAGADYVIVPAMSRDDDPAVQSWLRKQVEKGAAIIGVCAGAKVVAASGLLDGRRATTHWYYRGQLRKLSPTVRYVPDRRMVADGHVVTTTGISASIPMMLTLIEAIAGRTKAESIAHDLGLRTWDARHASDAFTITRPFAMTVLLNRLAFWTHEDLGLKLEPGMDEVTLALVSDAWSRTYRSRAITFQTSQEPIVTANAMRILPDQVTADWPKGRRVSAYPERRPAEALNQVLQKIGMRYGPGTASVVAMQLEYPQSR